MKRLSLLIFGVVILLVGCTAQLGYRYADTLVEWQLDEYVTLTDPQQEFTSQLIDELHRWHAQQELPKYRQSLQALRDALANKQFSASNLESIEASLWRYWGNLQQRIADEAEAINTLSFEQKEELLGNLQERLDERREEEREESESPILEQIDRVNRMEERLEEWTGDVTKEQQQLLHDWVKKIPDQDYWFDYRQRWHDQFAQVLLMEPVPIDALVELIVSPDKLRTEQHQDYMEQRRQLRAEYMLALEDSLTDDQRRRLLDKIDEYLTLLDDLIDHFAEAT